jgi:murein DD-endopeptidase MepM/ murein hydrolase activator NlpD
MSLRNRPIAFVLIGLMSVALLVAFGCATTPATDTQAADASSAYAAPDTSASTTDYKRKQYKGTTTFDVSPEATKDKKYLTPLPEEYKDVTAHLPEAVRLKLPFPGTFPIMTGYGFESNSWTHQTIGNTESANDFFALDFDVPVGTPILAPAAGRVVTSEDRTTSDSYGKYIVIDHGHGITTIYAHLDSLEYLVDHGNPEVYVQVGQQIGASGKSGVRVPHLHFAVHTDARLSHSSCDVGGKATVPEPLDGYYGLRSGQILTSTNRKR